MPVTLLRTECLYGAIRRSILSLYYILLLLLVATQTVGFLERHFNVNIRANITNKYSSVNGFPRFWEWPKVTLATEEVGHASYLHARSHDIEIAKSPAHRCCSRAAGSHCPATVSAVRMETKCTRGCPRVM